MNKQEVLDMLDELPEEFDPEQLMQHLYLKAKLERAEEAVEHGDVIPHAEVVLRSQEWFK
jgi:hypothetical protein